MAPSKYNVSLADFTKRHFIKTFEKKYKSQWGGTIDSIIFICERIDDALLTSHAHLINESGQHKIVKLDFAIYGHKISPRSSGNRCILHVDESSRSVDILLIYSKTDLTPANETAAWRKMIKNEYPELTKLGLV